MGIQVYEVANPAAGSDWSYPFRFGGRILAVAAQLATSATVANRIPSYQLTDRTGVPITAAYTSVAATASSTLLVTPGGTGGLGPSGGVLGLSEPFTTFYDTDWTLKSVTTALQAGDQWSNIRILVHEYGVRLGELAGPVDLDTWIEHALRELERR